MAEPTEKVWLDGKLVPWDQANVHLSVHALHYGSSVFEGIRAYDVKGHTPLSSACLTTSNVCSTPARSTA